MKNIEQYKNRFYNLMESTMGDVKPLISENQSKDYFKAASELLDMMSGLPILDNDMDIVGKFSEIVETPEDLQNLSSFIEFGDYSGNVVQNIYNVKLCNFFLNMF